MNPLIFSIVLKELSCGYSLHFIGIQCSSWAFEAVSYFNCGYDSWLLFGFGVSNFWTGMKAIRSIDSVMLAYMLLFFALRRSHKVVINSESMNRLCSDLIASINFWPYLFFILRVLFFYFSSLFFQDTYFILD